MMSLCAHLLKHVQESTERSLRNPKYYENLIFHSVPKADQVSLKSQYINYSTRRCAYTLAQP